MEVIISENSGTDTDAALQLFLFEGNLEVASRI
jgi:hypothetical protein